MKIYTFIFKLSLILISPTLWGQELSQSDKEFNLIYDKIAIEIAGQKPDLAIKKADSLYLASQNSYQKLKSLMLKAKVFAQIGDLAKSIEVAKEAEKVSLETDFFSWQARIAGFISTQYRISGLYSEAKKYLDKGLIYSKKIKSVSESDKIQSFIYQEKADIAKQEKNYQQAIVFLRESNEILEKLPKDKSNYYLLSTNDAYLADTYFLINSYDSARYFYNKATQNLSLSGFDDPKLNGFILMGMGKLDILSNDEKSGTAKIHKALEYADKAGALAVKEGANEALTEFYSDKKDTTKNYRTHAQLAIETVKEIAKVKQKAADHALQEAAKEKEALYQRSSFYVISISLLLLILGIAFIIYRNKKAREFKLFQKAINELRSKALKAEQIFPEQESLVDELQNDQVESDPVKKKDLISKETEEILLKKLEKFERGTKFTDKNMSMSMLGGILSTNTKYQNYIISKHRDRNFTQYINHLRITYIIQKMEENPEYLQYKISTMAEECGYSSHGKFTEAFKKETGINPSVFIEYMQKEKSKKTQKTENITWD